MHHSWPHSPETKALSQSSQLPVSLAGRKGPAESPRDVGRGRGPGDGPLAQPLRQPHVHLVVEVVEPLAGLALLPGKALVRRAGESTAAPAGAPGEGVLGTRCRARLARAWHSRPFYASF